MKVREEGAVAESFPEVHYNLNERRSYAPSTSLCTPEDSNGSFLRQSFAAEVSQDPCGACSFSLHSFVAVPLPSTSFLLLVVSNMPADVVSFLGLLYRPSYVFLTLTGMLFGP